MTVLITIPNEFEQHFQSDRFDDSLHRLSADAHLLAGNYEQETAKMLSEAFKSAVIVPPHGRLIDADALYEQFVHEQVQLYKLGRIDFENQKREDMHEIFTAPTIIEAEGT